MKKNKLKHYLKLGIFLFGISLLLVNCEKDNFEEVINDNSIITEEINQPKGYIIQKISLEELQGKQRLQKTIENISKTFDVNRTKEERNTASKVDANDGSFTILTDEIVQLSTDSTTTYTFKIETPTDESSTFENFTIDVANDSIIKFYIYKYIFEPISGGDFELSVDYEEVDENLIEITQFDGLFSKITTNDDCIQITYGACSSGGTDGHESALQNDGSYCSGSPVESISFNNCFGGGGGGGGSPAETSDTSTTGNTSDEGNNDCTNCGTGGNGSTTGTTTNTGTGTTNSTTAVLVPFEEGIEELKNILKNDDIRNRINQMVAELDTSPTEQGSEFRTTGTPNEYSEYPIPASDLGFDYTKFPNAISTSKVRAHMHHNTTDANGNGIASIFSAEDIFGMAHFYKQKKDIGSADAEDITSILVSIRGLYAFRISNVVKLEEFYNSLNTIVQYDGKNMTREDAIKEQYIDYIIENILIYCSNCTDAGRAALFETLFVNFFNQLDSGLSLYLAFDYSSGNYTWELLN